MKIQGRKIGIVTSAHIGTNRENVGDILSAQAIAKLLHIAKKTAIYYLPRDNGASFNKEVVYGGGGMIRPLFSEKVYKDFSLRSSSSRYYIYGVGLNKDILTREFSKKDLLLLKKWAGKAQSVTVRDFESQQVVQNILGRKCRLAPCPTYSILKTLKIKNPKTRYYLGFAVSFGHTETYRKYRKRTISFVTRLIKEIRSKNISLICHDKEDFDFAKELFSSKVYVCYPRTFREVKAEYSKCQNILSLRGHGVIFAAACGRPCSVIPLNKKLNSLYKYHYDEKKRFGISFKPRTHLEYFKKAITPKNIKVRFKL